MDLDFKDYVQIIYNYVQIAELQSEVVDGKITYKKGDYLIVDRHGNQRLAKKEHVEKNYKRVVEAVYVKRDTIETKELVDEIQIEQAEQVEQTESTEECQK